HATQDMRPRFANSGLFPHQEALSVLGRFLGEAPNASELWSPALEPSGYQCHGAFQYLAWISSGFILFVHFYSGRGLAGRMRGTGFLLGQTKRNGNHPGAMRSMYIENNSYIRPHRATIVGSPYNLSAFPARWEAMWLG
ncbi:hypothetical protein GX48_06908, partial [Paracoccidioides brasiliensis]